MVKENDALTKFRKSEMSRDVKISEIQMQQDNEGAQQLFQVIQSLKAKIIKEKQEASKAIDEKYADELTKLQQRYAIYIKLMR
jgi:hypothetical protein